MILELTNDETDVIEDALAEKGITEDDIWAFVNKEQISWSAALQVLLGSATLEEAKEEWVRLNEEPLPESYGAPVDTEEDVRADLKLALEITEELKNR